MGTELSAFYGPISSPQASVVQVILNLFLVNLGYIAQMALVRVLRALACVDLILTAPFL